jgi:hypothetical protein
MIENMKYIEVANIEKTQELVLEEVIELEEEIEII